MENTVFIDLTKCGLSDSMSKIKEFNSLLENVFWMVIFFEREIIVGLSVSELIDSKNHAWPLVEVIAKVK